MKDINIAHVLVNKRKEKGITQEELACHMGVSKASVSKWETGQSYPDVSLLPLLAAYFGISIDDLMDYKPQMTKAEIRETYHRLAADFASEPFDDVVCRCRETIKKYFSCFPLLLQMGLLLLNHSALAGDTEKAASLADEARVLFERVTKESNDVALTKQALYAQAGCHIALGNAPAALKLLEEAEAPTIFTETLLITAYQMTGDIGRAKIALQTGMYQHVVALLGIFPCFFLLYQDDPARCEEAFQRASRLAELFNIKKLHPSILANLYLSRAQGCAAQGADGKALDLLEQYAELVTGDIYPLRLRSDEFFDLLDDWLAGLDLGTAPPRDESIMRRAWPTQ